MTVRRPLVKSRYLAVHAMEKSQVAAQPPCHELLAASGEADEADDVPVIVHAARSILQRCTLRCTFVVPDGADGCLGEQAGRMTSTFRRVRVGDLHHRTLHGFGQTGPVRTAVKHAPYPRTIPRLCLNR